MRGRPSMRAPREAPVSAEPPTGRPSTGRPSTGQPSTGRPPAGPATVLRLRGVARSHGGRPVWAPLDLDLAAGTLTVLTGANGAGKTTLLRLAAGLLRPSAGERECAGTALHLRGGGGLRTAQTVLDAVTSTATLAGRGAAAPAALRLLGLEAFAARRVGTLSAGERVRAALAAAVACGPALLCLDEPTAVLDERGLADLVGVLEAVRADGVAVLVATHQPGPLMPVVDAHLVIEAGRVWLR